MSWHRLQVPISSESEPVRPTPMRTVTHDGALPVQLHAAANAFLVYFSLIVTCPVMAAINNLLSNILQLIQYRVL